MFQFSTAQVEPRVAALDALARQRRDQRLAVPGAALGGSHVQILQIDSVHAVPRREVEEPHGDSDHSGPHRPVLDRNVREHRRCRTEQPLVQLLDGDGALVRRALVVGKFVDQPDDDADVVRGRAANHALGPHVTFAQITWAFSCSNPSTV